MAIDFAPLTVPLRRRLQTAAVLQWVFSFLGLGESIHTHVTCQSWSMWGYYELFFTLGLQLCLKRSLEVYKIAYIREMLMFLEVKNRASPPQGGAKERMRPQLPPRLWNII